MGSFYGAVGAGPHSRNLPPRTSSRNLYRAQQSSCCGADWEPDMMSSEMTSTADTNRQPRLSSFHVHLLRLWWKLAAPRGAQWVSHFQPFCSASGWSKFVFSSINMKFQASEGTIPLSYVLKYCATCFRKRKSKYVEAVVHLKVLLIF